MTNISEFMADERADNSCPQHLTTTPGQRSAHEDAADRLLAALDATTPQGWPDYRRRLRAALAIINIVEGKPAKRRQIVHVPPFAGSTL